MVKATKTAGAARLRRHRRLRKKVVGRPQGPRLSVFRSLKHIYAQIIDDSSGHTLVAASDLEPALRQQVDGKQKREVAARVGQLVAERAQERDIRRVIFDRGGFKYHGRVKALAEAARKAGLQF